MTEHSGFSGGFGYSRVKDTCLVQTKNSSRGILCCKWFFFLSMQQFLILKVLKNAEKKLGHLYLMLSQ